MKITLCILGLLVALGVVYGLAFVGVIPVQKMADKNPALAKTLAAMHLATIKKAVPKTAAPPKLDPEQQAIQEEQKQIVADRAQLEKDKAAFEAEKQQAAAAPPAPSGPDTRAKLFAIYATMSPDDIATIFAKLPDPAVIQNLIPLDEKKAGKILAAMPADRAARLSQQMMAASPNPQQTAANPSAPQPQASLP